MHRPLALCLALALLAGCGEAGDAGSRQGYIEGEFVLLASPYGGQLEKLHVRRGDRVAAGSPVFALEAAAERAARAEAAERLRNAQARLDNLQAARRAPEIDALLAQLAQASTAAELSASQLAQQEKLFKGGFIAESRLDEARSAHRRNEAHVAEVQAQLRTARLPLGREAELAAAQAEVAGARAALEQAEWRLSQKALAAPAAAVVQDTFFVEGEWVPAGRPVASLLPPGNLKARFYIPETLLSSVSPGKAVEIRCDGCPAPVAAKVSFVSSQAEYTPPVLYSKESRSKLVFLVEARLDPADAANLRPGQPVDVSLK
ncbi:MAG TPA: HlyD family efflux transporter periplasmic adaptor subunit [Burkholderiales bacterium]|nr:HlyD family efflux transporter periplasmic adaptor subunit [Burkholderiales bacterium]